MAPGRPSDAPPPGPFPPDQPPPGAGAPPGYPGPGQQPPAGYPGYGQQPPAGYPGYGAGMKPHRGMVILVLGICGFVVCAICGIIAWVMANNDLREMEAGTMDPEGRELTNAGRICGMISTIFTIAVFGIAMLFIIIAFAGAASSGM